MPPASSRADGDNYSVAGATVYLEDGTVRTAIDTNGKNATLPSDRNDIFPGFVMHHAEPNAIGQLVRSEFVANIDPTKPLVIVVDRTPCPVCLRGNNDLMEGQILRGAEKLGITEVHINYLDRLSPNDPLNPGKVIGTTPIEVIMKYINDIWVIQ